MKTTGGVRIDNFEAALSRLRREEAVLAAEAEGRYYATLIAESRDIAAGRVSAAPTVEHIRALLHVLDGRT